MVRSSSLCLTLGWLSLGDTLEYPQQHVIGEDVVAGPKPLPQAAELVRDNHRLKAAEIIPTVIDDFFPSVGLHATWPSGSHAQLGNTLGPNDLDDEPSIALHDMRAAFSPPYSPSTTKHRKITYAVALTDPDAPSREDPSWSEFCHWIAAGVLKPALCDPRDPRPCAPVLSHLREVEPYKPPAPPEGTGFHRYVLLAFVPSNGTTEELHLSKPGGRKRWGYESGSGRDGDGGGGDARRGDTKGVRQWARENGLAPVGANFIYAKHQKE